MLAFTGLLASTVAVHADQVNPQGTMNVDADSAAVPFLFGDLITLPRILEDLAAEWADGSTIAIDAPDHFAFATNLDSVPAQVIAGDLLLVGQVGDTATATPTATQIQFTVDAPGQSSIASTIEFAGIRLRATDAIGATMGSAAITVTTAGTLVDATLVQVTVVPGAADPVNCSIALDPGSDGTATADGVDSERILVELQDQWGNLIGGENVTLEPNDGSPLPGDVIGAGPVATDNVTGIATFDVARTVAEPLQLRGSAAGEQIDLPAPVDLTFN
ncbi:MAG: hypothetical protein KKI02_04395, partial [Planctomycetes bacterium]|nr:hypothetical protein [Planctomycetota bacterium]